MVAGRDYDFKVILHAVGNKDPVQSTLPKTDILDFVYDSGREISAATQHSEQQSHARLTLDNTYEMYSAAVLKTYDQLKVELNSAVILWLHKTEWAINHDDQESTVSFILVSESELNSAHDLVLGFSASVSTIAEQNVVPSSIATVVKPTAAPAWGFRIGALFAVDESRANTFTARAVFSNLAFVASLGYFSQQNVSTKSLLALPFPPTTRDRRTSVYTLNKTKYIGEMVHQESEADVFDAWEARYVTAPFREVSLSMNRGRDAMIDFVAGIMYIDFSYFFRLGENESKKPDDDVSFIGFKSIDSLEIRLRGRWYASGASDGIITSSLWDNKKRIRVVVHSPRFIGESFGAQVRVKVTALYNANPVHTTEVGYATGLVSTKRLMPASRFALFNNSAMKALVKSTIAKWESANRQRVQVIAEPASASDKMMTLNPGSVISVNLPGFNFKCILRRIEVFISIARTRVKWELWPFDTIAQQSPTDAIQLGFNGPTVYFLHEPLYFGRPPHYITLDNQVVTLLGRPLGLYA